MEIKNGLRLESRVCQTQIIVVKASDNLQDLRCGGALMGPIGVEKVGALDNDLATGNVMGKRYVDGGDAEVLVTKAGAGTLTVGAVPLTLKESKPLPASD
jgi:hypothetical protein